MKITEYPSATDITDNNVFIIDGDNGTKKIAAEDLRYALFNDIPEMHRNMFRGKNLGNIFTTAQKTAVQNGTFDDLWVGDYWSIGGIDYRIVDIDYFYNRGNPKNSSHHLVIMPDQNMYKYVANTDSNGVGYEGTNLWKSGLNAAMSTINNAFQSSVLSTTVWHETSRNSSNIATAYRWATITVDIPSSFMLFGALNSSGPINSTVIAGPFTEILAAMRIKPELVVPDNTLLSGADNTASWTSSSVNGYTGLCVANTYGNPGIAVFHNALGVRPFFCIK